MSEAVLKAPFVYPGGKSRVAEVLWRAFGPDVPNYVEAACGSAAVLLARPGGAGKIETINDIDGFVTNFYRAVKADPDAVAHWCDWPVSELDMHARHRWLVNQHEAIEQMRADPDFYDVKIAGWWVFGINIWIGGGWCSTKRVERDRNARPHVSGNHADNGTHASTPIGGAKCPILDGIGKGIHADRGHQKHQLPDIAVPARARTTGKGTHALHQKLPDIAVPENAFTTGRKTHSVQIPSLNANVGPGTHGLPSIGNDRGLNGVSAPPCADWFRALAERLRRVRIVCGDFERVLGPSVLGKGKNVGGRRPCAVLLDPTYAHEFRAKGLYREDDPEFSRRAREWAIANGDDPDLRIALCGYIDEHGPHMPANWTAFRWKGARGYAGAENTNRERETIFFSPHCLPIDQQPSLFGGAL